MGLFYRQLTGIDTKGGYRGIGCSSSVTSPNIASTSAAQSARGRALDALLAWPGILLFWTAWGGAHAAGCGGQNRARSVQTKRAARKLAQYFSWGYSVGSPPDYAWFLWLTNN